jgi:hypothetical protein
MIEARSAVTVTVPMKWLKAVRLLIYYLTVITGDQKSAVSAMKSDTLHGK